MIYTIIGYFGSGFMIAFSWTFNPILAVVGLTLLTVQSCKAKMWNLVALNIVSIIGMFFQIFK